MKFSAQEEYGLRCLMQIARANGRGMTIPQVSHAEGITQTHATKLLRILRTGGFLQSTRGQVGGYTLARPAREIVISDVLAALGGRLFTSDFCQRHAGEERACTHNSDCSIRSLWTTVQSVVDRVLSRTTLDDLLAGEREKAGPAGLVSLEQAPPAP